MWHWDCKSKSRNERVPVMADRNNIAKEILNYLSKHPKASDTLEGITEWWLLNQRIGYEMKRVKAAVEQLVQKGWIIEIEGKNTKIRYRLNPEKQEESKL